jgi:hypothetical protein
MGSLFLYKTSIELSSVYDWQWFIFNFNKINTVNIYTQEVYEKVCLSFFVAAKDII